MLYAPELAAPNVSTLTAHVTSEQLSEASRLSGSQSTSHSKVGLSISERMVGASESRTETTWVASAMFPHSSVTTKVRIRS